MRVLSLLLTCLCVGGQVVLAQKVYTGEMVWVRDIECSGRPTDSVAMQQARALVETAQSYEAKGQIARAVAEYKKAISRAGQAAHCLSLVNLLLKHGDPKGAEATLRMCTQMDPDCLYVKLTEAFVLLRQDRFQSAQEILEVLLPSHGNNPYLRYLSGTNHLYLNNPIQAEAQLQRALELNPQLAAAHFFLGLLYAQKKSTYQKSRHHLGAAIQGGLKSARVHKQLGGLLIKLGEPAEAINHLSTAVKIDPHSPDLYYLLSQAYRATGNSSKAHQTLEHYEELRRKASRLDEAAAYGQSLHQTGVKLLDENRLDEALEVFRQGLDSHPDKDVWYVGIAEALLRKGDFDGCFVAIQKAIKLKPMQSKYHYFSAQSLEAAGKIPEAIAAAREAASLDPNNGELHNFLGNLYFNSGDFERAVSAFKNAVQADSRNPYFHLNLSGALGRMGRAEESAHEKEVFRKLLSEGKRPPQ